MRDELDRLIDGALADYSAAEPLAGLEQRVLDRVRDAQRSRRRRWRGMLAVAAPAVAAILAVVVSRRPETPPIAALPPSPAPPAVAMAPPPAPVGIATPRRIAPKPRPLPKRDVFPTPSPLTREERLLVQLAESRPEILEFKPLESIEIKPIEIAPLQIGGDQ
jgi:hypothetical protein